MNKLRTPLAAVFAVAVTFGLFIFMYKLISSGDTANQDLNAISGIRFGPVDIPDDLQRRERRKPKPPPKPKEPPPPPKMPRDQPKEVVQNMPDINIPNINNPMVGGDGMFIGNFANVDKTAEGDVIPIVRINPIYPRDAQMKGLSGWVRLEFTITPDGGVKDPTVLDAEPARIFNREAMRAILKWKFKPRVIDGVAVDRRATQTIEFNIGES